VTEEEEMQVIRTTVRHPPLAERMPHPRLSDAISTVGEDTDPTYGVDRPADGV
jgi:hypothetical protein